MPKVPPKRPVEVAKPAPVVQEEPKIIVWRLFECVVHLEQAIKHLDSVGIIPTSHLTCTVKGDATQVAVEKQRISSTLSEARTMARATLVKYKEAWAAMEASINA